MSASKPSSGNISASSLTNDTNAALCGLLEARQLCKNKDVDPGCLLVDVETPAGSPDFTAQENAVPACSKAPLERCVFTGPEKAWSKGPPQQASCRQGR